MPRKCRCCNNCSIFSANFDESDTTDLGADWSEVSGSWSISSNTLVTSSTSAVCVHDTAEGSAALSVTVDLQGTTGDFLRVIFGYVDSSNYWFAEVKIGSGTAGRLDIYQRSGGSNTLMRALASVSIPPSAWHSLKLCLAVEGHLSATLTLSDTSELKNGYSTALATELTVEDIVGIGTGSTASSVMFDNFNVEPVSTECASCTPAPRGCNACNDNTAPGMFKVTLAGIADGADHVPPVPPCDDINCDPLNGDWYVPIIDSGFASSCEYELAEPTPTPCSDTIFEGMYISMQIVGAGLLFFEISWGGPNPSSGGGLYFEKDFGAEPDCLTIDNEEFFLTAPYSPTPCSDTSVTCHVTSVV